MVLCMSQQKRNSKLVATLIIPGAEADSGKYYIRHKHYRNDPAFEFPFSPLLQVFQSPYLPPRKEEGDVSPFLCLGCCPVRDQWAFETSMIPLSLEEHWPLETLVLTGHFSASA